MEQITKFSPAYDKRDPDPKKNYGIGTVRCFMVLKGEHGAVHFVFGTGMHLPEYQEELKTKDGSTVELLTRGMGYDVGSHTKKPQFEGHEPHGACDWLDGEPCYCDGSALLADEWFRIFLAEGSDKIWEMLEERYKSEFGELK